jgi:hypothetical protein
MPDYKKIIMCTVCVILSAVCAASFGPGSIWIPLLTIGVYLQILRGRVSAARRTIEGINILLLFEEDHDIAPQAIDILRRLDNTGIDLQ